MELVATLIAAPAGTRLTDRTAGRVRGAFEEAGAEAGAPVWLAEGIACEFAFGGLALDAARAIAREAPGGGAFDLVVQPDGDRRKRLLIADMDATIVSGETLDELAAHAGLKHRIAEITARAMRGEVDFEGALRERVGMLRGLPMEALAKTLGAISLTPGARTLVQTMRAHGAHTVLVSGGFRFFTRHVAAEAGFHEELANELVVEDGRLTGDIAEPILDREAKLQALHRCAAEHDIPLSATLAAGDGANDLPLILAAGLGVAFHAKPVVAAAAPASISHGDLTALLYIQGYARREFTG